MNDIKTSPPSKPPHANRMHPLYWIPRDTTSLLEVGCNEGALLSDCGQKFPGIRLAGIEINPTALAKAKQKLPDAALHGADGERFPFADARFDCVTCIEVLEHIRAENRRHTLDEIHRVLKPGGRFILRVPHDGAFAWLDSNNVRFRIPRLYRKLIGQGQRDSGYADGSDGVIWHYHFSRAELLALIGDGWQLDEVRYGGLFVFPITDWLSWPFYRLGWLNNPIPRLLNRMADLDYRVSFGSWSYGILMTLRRI